MKAIKARLMVLLVLVAPVLPALSFASMPEAMAKEQLFFEDNFENYPVGTFPSSGGWELWYSGAGAEHQVIVDEVSVSPTNSLQLLGLDNWAGFAAKPFTSDLPLIGFEVDVRVEETNGRSNDNARVAFTTQLSYFISREYAPVTFNDDGTVCSGGQVLQSYEACKWYTIKQIMDRTSGTYSVWVDEELKAENLKVASTSGSIESYPASDITAFSVSQCYNGVTVYFDDVKMFYVYGANPKLELVPNTGVAATTLVGSGFAPNSQILVTWDGTLIPTVPNPLVSDSYGNFTAIISALNQKNGVYPISVTDEQENLATATFTVALEASSQTINETETVSEIANLEENVSAGKLSEFPQETNTLAAEHKTTTELNEEPNQQQTQPDYKLLFAIPVSLVATASVIFAKKRQAIPNFTTVSNRLHKILNQKRIHSNC